MPATHPEGPHGSPDLPGVTVDSYNLELRSAEGFIGDRASKRAFTDILEDWRERFRRFDDDPLGERPSEAIGKKKLDQILVEGDPDAAGLVHGAIEDFAQELAAIVRRFLRTKGWQGTQRIAVGGGFSASRVGNLAIGRTNGLLKGAGIDLSLVPIRHHPDHAGLIGTLHLVPPWVLEGFDGVLAVDIGGTNIRAGIVELPARRNPDLGKAKVGEMVLWRHAEDSPSRTAAVGRLVEMLHDLAGRARKAKQRLAPLVGIGCPGVIEPDGSIDRGGQNLPGGNWESDHFNLPQALCKAIPSIGDHDTAVALHNDAVVQGLSQAPFMQDVDKWGVLTIGTGLGNARFTNKRTG
jgi:hypothetical protein